MQHVPPIGRNGNGKSNTVGGKGSFQRYKSSRCSQVRRVVEARLWATHAPTLLSDSMPAPSFSRNHDAPLGGGTALVFEPPQARSFADGR